MRGNTRLDETSGRRHFFAKKQILTHFFMESDRVFSASAFSAYSSIRDGREDTYVQCVVSLLVFDVVFVERDTTVELSVYALGMKSSSLIRYLLFVELKMSTKYQ